MINPLAAHFPLPSTTALWEEDRWRRQEDPIHKIALLAWKIFLTFFTVSVDLILQLTNHQSPFMRKAQGTTLLSSVRWGLSLLDSQTKQVYLESIKNEEADDGFNIFLWVAQCSEIQAIIRNPTSKNFPYKVKKEAFASVLLPDYQGPLSSQAKQLAKEIREQSFALHQTPIFQKEYKAMMKSLNP